MMTTRCTLKTNLVVSNSVERKSTRISLSPVRNHRSRGNNRTYHVLLSVSTSIGRLIDFNFAVILGVIMGVLGSEDTNGDFKVVDVCYAGEGAQEQPAHMETGTTI